MGINQCVVAGSRKIPACIAATAARQTIYGLSATGCTTAADRKVNRSPQQEKPDPTHWQIHHGTEHHRDPKRCSAGKCRSNWRGSAPASRGEGAVLFGGRTLTAHSGTTGLGQGTGPDTTGPDNTGPGPLPGGTQTPVQKSAFFAFGGRVRNGRTARDVLRAPHPDHTQKPARY